MSPTSAPPHETLVGSLPAPFNRDSFRILQQGIYEHPEITVYVNAQNDFAFLAPQPAFNYTHYQSRVNTLALGKYRQRNQAIERRYAKLKDVLVGNARILEIGTWDAAFLHVAHETNAALQLACVEPDQATRSLRDSLPGLEQFNEIKEVKQQNRRFDVVCFFHVLEHIPDPRGFLTDCHQVLAPQGKLILEVPSLDDPLLSLYHSSDYRQFYFQMQHPYVYSSRSIERLLAEYGFAVTRSIPHQRYGMENHLTWLTERRPGGNEAWRDLFEPADASYRTQLEKAGQTDAIIVIAEAATIPRDRA